ncbi:MAG: hypothetical protein ABJH04_08270 [Cyclobacteriaceae bacterium]
MQNKTNKLFDRAFFKESQGVEEWTQTDIVNALYYLALQDLVNIISQHNDFDNFKEQYFQLIFQRKQCRADLELKNPHVLFTLNDSKKIFRMGFTDFMKETESLIDSSDTPEKYLMKWWPAIYESYDSFHRAKVMALKAIGYDLEDKYNMLKNSTETSRY